MFSQIWELKVFWVESVAEKIMWENAYWNKTVQLEKKD